MVQGIKQRQFINVGDRVVRIGKSKSRFERWPKDVWLEAGVMGTVTEYHDKIPAMTLAGTHFEAIPAWAIVTWDLGAEVQTVIDVGSENESWKRL